MPNQTSKSRTKSHIEVNEKARRMYNTNSPVKSKTIMSKSILCDYNDS